MKKSKMYLCLLMVPILLVLLMSTSTFANTSNFILDYSIDATFNGTNSYINKTNDLNQVSNLTGGTIVAKFKTSSNAEAQAIFSASDNSVQSSNITLSVNSGGYIRYENRDADVYGAQLNTEGGYNDGNWHTVALIVDTAGTKIFIDGLQVANNIESAFFASVNNLNNMSIGCNVDSGGGQWYFNGKIAFIKVYDYALTETEINELCKTVPILKIQVNKNFNGINDYIDKISELSMVKFLSEGSIIVKFRTASTATANTLISASDSTDESSNITLSINSGGVLHYENRDNNRYATNLDTDGGYNDGKWHVAILTVDEYGTYIYIDGEKVISSNATAFFSSVEGLDIMGIGRNVDLTGGEWYYKGDIDNILVYKYVLSMNEIMELNNMAQLKLFYAGLDGSANYRIPSLVTTTNGTLIAAVDARIQNSRDNPNNIDKYIRRSTDNGLNWNDSQVLIDYPGYGEDGAAAIDPAMLVDEETGRIWMLYLHTPGGIGLLSSQKSMGFDENGYRLLYDTQNNVYTLREDGIVYNSNNQQTSMTVAINGDVYDGTNKIGNMYLKEGASPILEARTSFLQIIYSDDDGLTWSEPRELNMEVKEPWMKFIGAGPGRGIQLKVVPYSGRIVFPIYFTNSHGIMSNAVIYSDDHGVTWHRGESPNDGRWWLGRKISAKNLIEHLAQLSESQVVELDDGTLKIFMRNHSTNHRTAVATSADGGMTWSNVTFDNTLLDSRCQSTVIRYPNTGNGKEYVIFVNPANTSTRIDGVVRLSEDGGNTWAYSRMIKPGDFAYSCLTILQNGEIGLIYETDNYNSISYVKFTLDWIMRK